MGLFKTKYHPTSQVELTNDNCKFVHTISGNDSTGTGTRENPYATIVRAGSNCTILINGYSNESVSPNYNHIIGDTSESGILTITYMNWSTLTKIKVENIASNVYGHNFEHCIIGNFTGDLPAKTLVPSLRFNFIKSLKGGAIPILVLSEKNTIGNFYNYQKDRGSFPDCLIHESVDLYNYISRSTVANYPVFKNCLFRKATVWKWNGTPITINWNGAGTTLMEKVYNSLLAYANSLPRGNSTQITDSDYAKAILATQSTMFQDCVVYDDSDSANPIFSRYVNGVPVDYTLALKLNNPALYMSTTGSYVGCYAANVNDDGHGNHITFGVVKHVDVTTGLDTATAPDLLVQDPSNPAKFSASQSSLQLWNRIRTSVVEYPRGKSFAGMQSQLDSGITSRLFFGKRQEIRTTGDISQKTTAFESVEVIPYDSLPTPNTGAENTIDNMSTLLPRFSAPFNGECLIFYKADVPLKFNDYNGLKTLFTGAGTVAITSGSAVVTGTSTTFTADFVKDDNIRIAGVDYKVLSIASNTSMTLTANVGVTLTGQTYQVGVTVDKSYTLYGNWAVTNADIESYSLIQKATKAGLTTSIPLIKWCKFELNLHYDEE